ncbi:RidA family protein [Euzebya tangerina]|uniref:RidA family protein n=1 Tax=Euzebya tangerina TaxID=591198 RepID=UPI002F35D4DE
MTPQGLTVYRDEWHMSPGIISGGLLWLTGMTGHRPEDNSFADDPEVQIREAFEKVEAVLVEAGLTSEDMVEMTSYHVDLQGHIDVFQEVRDEFVREPNPAWTAIEVSGFVTPGAIVELRVVADASGLPRPAQA